MLTPRQRWKKCTQIPSPGDSQASEEAGHTIQPFRLASPEDACQAELLLLENTAPALPPSQLPASGDRTAEIAEIFEMCFLTGFIPVSYSREKGNPQGITQGPVDVC